MQDEPEVEVRFQRKVSLKSTCRGSSGDDRDTSDRTHSNHRAGRRLRRSERSGAVPTPGPGRCLRLRGADADTVRLPRSSSMGYFPYSRPSMAFAPVPQVISGSTLSVEDFGKRFSRKSSPNTLRLRRHRKVCAGACRSPMSQTVKSASCPPCTSRNASAWGTGWTDRSDTRPCPPCTSCNASAVSG